MLKFVAVGHLTHDLQPDGSLTPGGAAYYSSITARYLGAQVTVISSVSKDYIGKEELARLGIALLAAPSPCTTTFENRYHNGQRQQHVRSLAHRIEQPLPPADVAFVGPVMEEIPLESLGRSSEHCLQVAGLQGWMRQVDSKGLVYPVALPAPEYFSVFDAVFVSEADFISEPEQGAQRLARIVPIVALTKGAQGSVVYVHGTPHPVAANVAIELDPTGAGDVYGACFAMALANGDSALDAAAKASALAARSVEERGAHALKPQTQQAQSASFEFETPME